MNCSVRRLLPAFLLWIAVLTIGAPARAQEMRATTRAAITVLDSTKEQDGLFGAVRRVKTETAKIELKDGRPIEGPPQLVEITTYGIKGNRIENTSYPIGGSLVGKEEYKYDERGNIIEMTVRDDKGAILNREAYSYEFDKIGNWTKMVTSLVVFENGELKREPIEVTYRTLTYYFDDNVAKLVEEPKAPAAVTVSSTAPAVPEPVSGPRDQEVLDVGPFAVTPSSLTDEPPRLSVKSVKSVAKPAADNTETKPATINADKTDNANAKLAEGLFLAGREFLKLEKDREAIKSFKESIKLNPNSAEAFYGLGYCSFRLARFRDAAEAFKKAVALDPQMAKAHFGLSLAYQELNMTQQLMAEYRILERLDGTLAKKLAQTFPQINFSCRLVQGCP
ncbi:MAG TPA: tetratricopeptide repeat protein [Pyrinomonadaceae bacterium]|jgi:tetratricopeptide (TPR) repeat protein|nr:tetratricopeptide repeat protein [Pyrinomonadaceae bacterium]